MTYVEIGNVYSLKEKANFTVGTIASGIVCGNSLPNSKLRRNIFSDGACDVKELLFRLLEQDHNCTSITQYLESSKVVCRKCFSDEANKNNFD